MSKTFKIAISTLPKKPWWGSGIPSYEDNELMKTGVIPNQQLLVSQYKNLLRSIQSESYETIQIHFPENLETNNGFDFIFMRDHFITHRNKNAVICNMNVPERKNEPKYTIEPLKELGYNVLEINDLNKTFEGGDIFYLPEENILLAGNNRNSQDGLELLSELLGIRELKIIPNFGFHIDTSLSPIFDNQHNCIGIQCAESMFSSKDIIFLKELCRTNNWELLILSTKENRISENEFRTNLNSLTLPGLIVSNSKNHPKMLLDFLKSHNVSLIECPVTEFALSGGSIHCLTNELY